MSVDITVLANCCGDHNHQFTYNYTPVLREVGFPAWKYFEGLKASVVGTFVSRVLPDLRANRTRLEPLIKGDGGWGTMYTLIESMEALQESLERHPLGMVRVG